MDQNNIDVSPKSPTKSIDEIAADYQLDLPAWSLEHLKTAAIQQRTYRPRSLLWAILLNALPTPNTDIISSIKSHRNVYEDLKVKLCMDPRAAMDDDPLSQNDESAWKQHFCDNELKSLILQDVVRTFPDELYFRDKDVQDMMVRVLFHWSRAHSHIGYRQGMHEVLAPLLFELFQDRKFAPDDISEKLKIILADKYLEHDSYMLLSAVMKGLVRFYTTGDVIPSSCGRLPVSKVVHNPNEVVRYLEKVRDEYLVPLDPELAAHLADTNVSMELFGIRWLRLLFGREFPRSEIPNLWSFIFADGPALPHLHYIIVAMLMSMRDTLFSADAGVVLCALMRPRLCAAHVCARALHLRDPQLHPPPPLPPPLTPNADMENNKPWNMEQGGSERSLDSGSEGVAEGADVARELAALALLRAQLPPAAAALARALPRPPPHVQQPLQQILHLAALLQCRNHALIDVETALEAAEGQTTEIVGRRQLVPVTLNNKRTNRQAERKHVNRIREVPLKVFNQTECDSASSASDLPCLDPLGLRTE